MQVRYLLVRYFLLIMIGLIINPVVFAKNETLTNQIQNFKELSKRFVDLCFNLNGEFIHGVVSGEGVELSCEKNLGFLNDYYRRLEEVAKANSSQNGPCHSLSEIAPQASILALATADALLKHGGCKKSKETEAGCMISMACNAFASVPLGAASKLIYTGASKFYDQKGLDIKKSEAFNILKKCSSVETSCLANIFRGVWDTIFTTIGGAWELVKFIGKGAWKATTGIAGSIGSLFADVEDKTSDKMMAAQQVDDSMLDKFKKDPLGFVKEISDKLYQTSAEAIKEHYGCDEWSGAPFISECLVPMQSWECANCNQRMNAVCGVVGFVAGEVVTAFLTGGAVSIVKASASVAAKGGVAATTRMAKVLKSFPRVDMALTTSARFLAGSRIISDAWSRVARSEGVQLILAASSTLKRTIPLQAAAGVTSVAAKPITAYLKLLKKSAEFGARGADNLLNQVGRLGTGETLSIGIKNFRGKGVSPNLPTDTSRSLVLEHEAVYPSRFRQSRDQIKKLKDSFPELKNIPDEDIIALRRYTYFGDGYMNFCLRYPKKCKDKWKNISSKFRPPWESPKYYRALNRSALAALKRMPAHKGQATRIMRLDVDELNRISGAKLTRESTIDDFSLQPMSFDRHIPPHKDKLEGMEDLQNKIQERTITDPGFISTSSISNPNLADMGSSGIPVRMNIKTKGKKCHPIHFISIVPQEKEVLCEPGTTFKIKNAQWKKTDANEPSPFELVLEVEEIFK